MKPKIAIIAIPHTLSSKVMAAFEDAGFRLGDVDRRADESYPRGRLELWPLAKLTSGRDKMKPPPKHEWPAMDLSDVDVAKAMPAWVPILKEHGFNYFVVSHRSGIGLNIDVDRHEELNANGEIDPKAIYQRACLALGVETPKRRGRPPKQQGEGHAYSAASNLQRAERNPPAETHEEGVHGQARDDQP